MEKDLYTLALAAVGGKQAELARRCAVSNQTVQNWKAGKISRFGERLLKEVLAQDTSE